MPQVQFIDGRDRRSMAEALAPHVAALRDERAADDKAHADWRAWVGGLIVVFIFVVILFTWN